MPRSARDISTRTGLRTPPKHPQSTNRGVPSPSHAQSQRQSPSKRTGDSSILRGAALIRKEISRQFQLSHASDASSQVSQNSVSQNSSSEDYSDLFCRPQQQGQQDQQVLQQTFLDQSECLDYSLSSLESGINTLASNRDPSQWANGAVLVSPDQVEKHQRQQRQQPQPLSRSETPQTQMGRDRRLTVKMKTHIIPPPAYDFIEEDYMEEFELDDYDEVCHPNFSRPEEHAMETPIKENRTAAHKRALRRYETPSPASTPPKSLLKAPKKRDRKTPSPPAVSSEHSAGPESLKITALFEERRQGPPSPATSSTSGSAVDSAAEVPSPLQTDYALLLEDPAYRHAQQAGHLWQSLVGHHIRFPSRWWNGARAPPLGMERPAPWEYLGRFASHDKQLRRFVKNRAAPGRLLLHICMLDLVTCKPLQDIVVGCFHPSARGIRRTEHADSTWDDVRDLWLAIRKRSPDSVSVMDKHLQLVERPTKSPLGPRGGKLTNANVRAVFGEAPPVETLFVPESYLYELYMAAAQKSNHRVPPPLLLVQEFVLA
jgi:hypothetical protein